MQNKSNALRHIGRECIVIIAETLPERVQRVLRTEVAAALMLDGAELEVLDVSDGIARVRFGGTCASCPATILTLITGLEAELRKHVPEVEYIEATI